MGPFRPGAAATAARGSGSSGDTGGTPSLRDAGADLRARDGGADRSHAADASAADGRPRDAAPSTDSGSARDAGARDGGPDAAGKKPRVLSLVLDGARLGWYATQATQGMAVDSRGRVYVGDNAHVFVVDGTSVSTYLTVAEAAGPMATETGFGDLDIGPDGRLYIVMAAFVSGTGSTVGVVRSSQAHQADPWVDLSAVGQPQKLSVIADGYLALVSADGFWTFTDAGGRLVYDKSLLIYTYGCATEDLAADPSGVFLYQSGCNGYPLSRGNADGTNGVGVLYDTDAVDANNFLCATRDPSGGFDIVVEDTNDDAPRLYHVDETASGAPTWIETAPSFAEAKMQKSSTCGFEFCSLATAPDGTVFFQSYAQLLEGVHPERRNLTIFAIIRSITGLVALIAVSFVGQLFARSASRRCREGRRTARRPGDRAGVVVLV